MLDRATPREDPERPDNVTKEIEVSILTALRGAKLSNDRFLTYLMAIALEHLNQEQPQNNRK